MKKIIFLMLFVSLSLVSCKKDEDKLEANITTETTWDLTSNRKGKLTVFDGDKTITFTNTEKLAAAAKGNAIVYLEDKEIKNINLTFSDGKATVKAKDIIGTLKAGQKVDVQIHADINGVKTGSDFEVTIINAISLNKKLEGIVNATANTTLSYKVSTISKVKVDEVIFKYKKVSKGANATNIKYTEGLPGTLAAITLPVDGYEVKVSGARLTSEFSAVEGDTIKYLLEAKKGSIVDNVTDSFVFKGQYLEAAKRVVFTDKDSKVNNVTSKREMFYNFSTAKLGNATGHLKMSADGTKIESGDVGARRVKFKWDNKTKEEELNFAAEPVQFVKLTGDATANEKIYKEKDYFSISSKFTSGSKLNSFTASKGDYYYYKVTRHYNKTTDSKERPTVGTKDYYGVIKVVSVASNTVDGVTVKSVSISFKEGTKK